jgi:hypothetical protein
MALKRRLARLEQQLCPRPVRLSESAWRQYYEDMWRAWGRPGDPPLPDELISEEEATRVIDGVYARVAWLRGQAPRPPVIRRPPYLVDWVRTGRAAHPLVRFAVYAATLGCFGMDENDSPLVPTEPIRPYDPANLLHESSNPDLDPGPDPGSDLHLDPTSS